MLNDKIVSTLARIWFDSGQVRVSLNNFRSGSCHIIVSSFPNSMSHALSHINGNHLSFSPHFEEILLFPGGFSSRLRYMVSHFFFLFFVKKVNITI